MVRDFCVREVKPYAGEWDREERFPREVVAQLGELGLLGMTVPEELGGAALDSVSIAAVVEEVALTEPDRRQKGVTAFLLEKGLKGFSQRPLHGKLGMRSSDTAELVFEDVFLEDWRRIGEVNAGFVDTLKILDKGRITIGALSV